MTFYHSIQKSIQDILWGFIIKTAVIIVNFVTDKGMVWLLFTGHYTGRRFHAGSMKIPRQPARYGAECSISVHREACYWTRSEQ